MCPAVISSAFLALALLTSAPGAGAQETPDEEALQGTWVLSEAEFLQEGAAIPIPGGMLLVSHVFIFEGARVYFRITDARTGTLIKKTSGTFTVSGGILRLTPDDETEAQEWSYTLERNTLRLTKFELTLIHEKQPPRWR